MLHRVVRGTGQRERKTFTRFYGNAYGRWKRIAARQSGSPADNIYYMNPV
ncbi:hypothetical protein [Dialister invisus]